MSVGPCGCGGRPWCRTTRLPMYQIGPFTGWVAAHERRVRDSNPRRCHPRPISNRLAMPAANPPCAPRTGLEPVHLRLDRAASTPDRTDEACVPGEGFEPVTDWFLRPAPLPLGYPGMCGVARCRTAHGRLARRSCAPAPTPQEPAAGLEPASSRVRNERTDPSCFAGVEPAARVELAAAGLQGRCATAGSPASVE